MRLATYRLPGEGAAEVSVSKASGSLLNNVNRWRGQLGLAPVDQVDPASLELVACPAGEVAVIDLTEPGKSEPAGRRFRIGMIQETSGASGVGGVGGSPATWFFKLQGPAEAVAREAQAFDQMLKTLRRETHEESEH